MLEVGSLVLQPELLRLESKTLGQHVNNQLRFECDVIFLGLVDSGAAPDSLLGRVCILVCLLSRARVCVEKLGN